MFGIMNCSVSQINIPAVLIANGLGASLMLLILIGKRRRMRMISYDGKFFYWMCQLCVVLCCLETIAFFVDGRLYPGARLVSILCNTMILLSAAVMAFLWVCYVDYKLFSDHRRLQTIYPLVAIPAVLMVLMSVANLFFSVFFTVDEANLYHRTPLFILPWFIVYGYMIYGTVLTHRFRKQADKYLFMPVILFLFPIYLGSLIQLFYYGISLIWASTAVGLTFLYINLQNEEAYLDPLTKLYNRSYLLHYLDHMVRHAKLGRRVTGIMLDINNFKLINDSFGHTEGDLVLRAVGKILLRSVQGEAVVVRYGGDEFVILAEDSSPQQVQDIQDGILRRLQSYNASGTVHLPISLSIGAAEFDHENVYEFFQDMDLKMYKEKRAFYLSREIDEVSPKLYQSTPVTMSFKE